LRDREARNLLFAVTKISPADFFGSHGWYLIGRAYADLGLTERAAEVFDQALLQTVRPAGADRMLLDLARWHLGSGRTEQAETLLTAATGAGDSRAAMAARIQLCEMAALGDDAHQVLDRCRNLLHECPEPADRQRLLRVMGRVYQRAGNYAAAALCFTGSDPESSLAELNSTE
jgi:hypothetical protein